MIKRTNGNPAATVPNRTGWSDTDAEGQVVKLATLLVHHRRQQKTTFRENSVAGVRPPTWAPQRTIISCQASHRRLILDDLSTEKRIIFISKPRVKPLVKIKKTSSFKTRTTPTDEKISELYLEKEAPVHRHRKTALNSVAYKLTHEHHQLTAIWRSRLI